MFVGGAAFFISAVQVALVFLLWRLAHAPGWLIAASIGLTAAEGSQMASGRLQLFALHLPLGTALFGASIALAIWAWMGDPRKTPSSAGARGVASPFGGLKMEKKL